MSGADIVGRYRDTMGLTREGAIRRMHELMDRIEDDAATITALRDRVTYLEALVEVFQRDNPPLSNAALQAKVERKDVAMERAIMLIERNLYRQSEKVEDAKNILRAVLERPKP